MHSEYNIIMTNHNSNNLKTDLKAIKLTAEDWGWVSINIGMGVGAGIVFLPIVASLVGLWTFVVAILIAYPGLYLFQRLFINTIAESPVCDAYPTIIRNYLGKTWGIIIGMLYFIMLTIWVLVYSETITNDSAAYLQTYKVTNELLSEKAWYSLIIVCVLVFISFKSKKLLFNISKFLVIIILSILLILSFTMIQFWDLKNLEPIASFWETLREIIVTLPFAMTSILFIQSLSPMVIAARTRSATTEEGRLRSIKIMRTAFLILAGIVFFFAFSCTMSVDYTLASEAYRTNTSFLVLISKHMHSVALQVAGIVLGISAVVTSFLGVLLGFYEACSGIAISTIYTPTEDKRKQRLFSSAIVIFTILVAWSSPLLDIQILSLTSICSPIFGIVGCFVPVILVYSCEPLRKYRGFIPIILLFLGTLLVLSPLLAFTL